MGVFFDKLGIVVPPRMRAVAAADEENMPNLARS